MAKWLRHMRGSHEMQGSNSLAGTLGPSLVGGWKVGSQVGVGRWSPTREGPRGACGPNELLFLLK